MRLKNLFFLLLFISVSLTEASDIILDEESSTYFVVTDRSLHEFSFINTISEISGLIVKKDNEEFLSITIPSYGSDSDPGDAELPVLQKLIRVPYGANVSIQILNKEERIINLSDFGYNIDIFPDQPSIMKSEDPEDVPFYYNHQYYSANTFFENELIGIEHLGKMRGNQLSRLSISPISYNPTKNELKIVTKLEVKVIFKDIDVVNDIRLREKYYSPEFETLFKNCVNYTPVSKKDVITTYPVKYVIISDPMFQSILQPFIEWKTKKGFTVVEGLSLIHI